jgi:hypothetical protein
VKAWALPARATTLVVRYEALAVGDEATLAAISAFTGCLQTRPFDISFDRLHALYPAFFRRGSDAANISELDRKALRLFEQQHGETLRAMGYGRSGALGCEGAVLAPHQPSPA